ncbi:MAG: hypothetical protein ACTH4Y_11545 [Microbacterium gubbeenense]
MTPEEIADEFVERRRRGLSTGWVVPDSAEYREDIAEAVRRGQMEERVR